MHAVANAAKGINPGDVPLSVLRALRLALLSQNRRIRSSALRTLRYLCKDKSFITTLVSIHVDYCVVRSLERDKVHDPERLQALKLIRKIMEVDCNVMPRSLVQSLVAVAENPEDNFKRVCLETLCEITIRNPALVALTNGLRTIFASVLEPVGQEIMDSLVLTILYVLNDENTRSYVRKDLELEVILSPFTDPFVQEGTERETRLGAARSAVVSMMRSWSGILCMSADEYGLHTLVHALSLPSKETKKAVLTTLYEIFRLSPQSGGKKGQQPGRVSTMPATKVSEELESLNLPPRSAGRHNLLSNYLAALVVAFVHCGLIEALVELGKGPDKYLSSRSTTLLGEILYLANTLLPPAVCARMQTLPTLVNDAAFFSLDPADRSLRSRASTMLNNLHQFLRTKKTQSNSLYDFHLSLIVTGAHKWRRVKGVDRSMDRVDDLKSKIDSMMDDPQFFAQVKESMVIDVKDHGKWNWAIISELLEGPLLNNPARLSLCLKNKFFKRLLSFYKPEKKLFVNQPYTPENVRYVRVMCQVFETLLNSDEGYTYLGSNALLPQLANILRIEVDPNPDAHPQRVLKREKVLKTMAREYFTLLGTLSSHARGLELMQKFKIWSQLYPMSELQGREDLSRLIVTSLDYNVDGTHSRVLLSKSMRSGSKEIRFHATAHMRVLLRAAVSDFSKWGIDLLVTQLYDPDPDVANVALSVLDEAVDDLECLESLISKRPSILQMGYTGKNLQLRFLSVDSGFAYLNDIEVVASEMVHWKKVGCIAYVNSIETALANAMNLAWDADASNTNHVPTPPHLYGELARTAAGCALLRQHNIVPELLSTVCDDSAKSLLRRAALWALGNIGACTSGFELLREHDVLSKIVAMAESSACLSLRGTCFYVLGLISRSDTARESLGDLGWESPADCNAGIAVPRKLERFFAIPPYRFQGSWAQAQPFAIPEGTDEDTKEVLTALSNLSNHITADGASRTLRKLKTKSPALFTSLPLLMHAYRLLELYHFRLPVRRFLHEQLFDVEFTEEAFGRLPQRPV
eukprot:TRINITY_DN3004_c0_g1_i1.p1 TRINITY_DN3004_c0_g1~~TRINITY_DN3004_c0_g1_i1.p1  ORF type:complete len:1085 (-),score=258.97 TRINITY_DN3004_c0_g1_i1:103-3207(-)